MQAFLGTERPLTPPEYVFASVGTTGGALTPSNVALVLEGEGPRFDVARWRDALDQASAANPGCRMRIVGTMLNARWAGDGQPPRLRVVESTDWDGMSSAGAAFIHDAPLSLEDGPSTEIILVNNAPRGRLLVFRTSHALMDGRGSRHFIAEIFRAMRGEPLIGSKADFATMEFPKIILTQKPEASRVQTDWLTGAPRAGETGFEWRRLRVPTSGQNVLGRAAEALAAFMHRRTDLPAVFTIPIDLRRHLPGFVSTMNFTGQLRVPFHKGDSAQDFREKLHRMLSARMEVYPQRGGTILKLLPRRWIDRVATRLLTSEKRPFQTAVVTNGGRTDIRTYSCSEFHLKAFFSAPFAGATMVALSSVGTQLDLVITMPKKFSSDGRLEDLMDHLEERLSDRVEE